MDMENNIKGAALGNALNTKNRAIIQNAVINEVNSGDDTVIDDIFNLNGTGLCIPSNKPTH